MKYSKYRNKKVIIDGIKFDSIKESKRYLELKMLEKANEINNLKLQPKFILQESFEKNGKKYREIIYIADFEYFDIKKGKWIIEDVKGMKTDVYKIKKKLFEYKFIYHELIEV